MADNKKAKDRAQDAPNKGPVWSYQSNRVSASVFEHRQDDGGVRRTIAICRSYFDRDEGVWKRTHFYDERDLPDVETCKFEATKYLNARSSTEAEAA